MANFYVHVTGCFGGYRSLLQLCKLFYHAIVSQEPFLFRANCLLLTVVRSYFSHVTDCPMRSVFIVLTENQSEPDPSQGFPEILSPSIMCKREELWVREWLNCSNYCACSKEQIWWKWPEFIKVFHVFCKLLYSLHNFGVRQTWCG